MADFCCQMRRKFIVAPIADDTSVPLPTEAVDFVVAWEPVVTLRLPFCCFCGVKLAADAPVRVIAPAVALPPRSAPKARGELMDEGIGE